MAVVYVQALEGIVCVYVFALRADGSFVRVVSSDFRNANKYRAPAPPVGTDKIEPSSRRMGAQIKGWHAQASDNAPRAVALSFALSLFRVKCRCMIRLLASAVRVYV